MIDSNKKSKKVTVYIVMPDDESRIAYVFSDAEAAIEMTFKCCDGKALLAKSESTELLWSPQMAKECPWKIEEIKEYL